MCGQNLILNGDFANGLDHWTSSGISVVEDNGIFYAEVDLSNDCYLEQTVNNYAGCLCHMAYLLQSVDHDTDFRIELIDTVTLSKQSCNVPARFLGENIKATAYFTPTSTEVTIRIRPYRGTGRIRLTSIEYCCSSFYLTPNYQVMTRDIITSVEEYLPVGDIRKDLHLIKDLGTDSYVPLVHNVCLDPSQRTLTPDPGMTDPVYMIHIVGQLVGSERYDPDVYQFLHYLIADKNIVIDTATKPIAVMGLAAWTDYLANNQLVWREASGM